MRGSRDRLTELRGRILEFQQFAATKLVALYDEGLVNNRDRMKLEAEVQSTASALLESMESTTYSHFFKDEWLLRIELGYRERIVRQITEIENRRYTDQAVFRRMTGIVESTLATIESHDQRMMLEMESTRLIKRMESDVRGISRNHSRRSQLIEVWLQEFEQRMQSLAQSNSSDTLATDSLTNRSQNQARCSSLAKWRP